MTVTYNVWCVWSNEITNPSTKHTKIQSCAPVIIGNKKKECNLFQLQYIQLQFNYISYGTCSYELNLGFYAVDRHGI